MCFVCWDSPEVIHRGIAKLLKHTAGTGDYPTGIKQGILVPLPKPGKKTRTTTKPETYHLALNTPENPCLHNDQMHIRQDEQ